MPKPAPKPAGRPEVPLPTHTATGRHPLDPPPDPAAQPRQEQPPPARTGAGVQARTPARQHARTRVRASVDPSPELAALRRMVDVEARRYIAMHAKLTTRAAELTAALDQARAAGATSRDITTWLADIPGTDAIPATLRAGRPPSQRTRE